MAGAFARLVSHPATYVLGGPVAMAAGIVTLGQPVAATLQTKPQQAAAVTSLAAAGATAALFSSAPLAASVTAGAAFGSGLYASSPLVKSIATSSRQRLVVQNVCNNALKLRRPAPQGAGPFALSELALRLTSLSEKLPLPSCAPLVAAAGELLYSSAACRRLLCGQPKPIELMAMYARRKGRSAPGGARECTM